MAVLWSSSGQFRAMTVPDCFGSLSGWGGPKSERRTRSVSEAQTRLDSAVIYIVPDDLGKVLKGFS